MNRDLFVAALAACVGAIAGAATTAVMLGVVRVDAPAPEPPPQGALSSGVDNEAEGSARSQMSSPQSILPGVGSAQLDVAHDFTTFNSVIAPSEQNDDVVVDQAFVCLLNGQPQAALDVLDESQITRLEGPRSAEAKYWRARCLRSLGRYEEAVAALEDLVAKHGESEFADDALFLLGDVLETDLQRYDQAVLCYQRLEAAYPESRLNPGANLRQGDIFLQTANDIPSAQKAYAKAQSLSETNDLQQNDVQTAQVQVNNWENSRAKQRLSWIEQNRGESGDEPLKLFAVAEHHLVVGDAPAAIGILRDLLERFPDHSLVDDCRWLAAQALQQAGLLDQARAELLLLVESHPQSPHLELAKERLGEVERLQKAQARAAQIEVEQAAPKGSGR